MLPSASSAPGPPGLLLGHLLHLNGIESITVEIRSEQRVIDRVRAGVLEQTTVDLLAASGLGERLAREGLRHEGLYIAFGGTRHRVDLAELTGGRAITVYGQNEVVRDLLAARHNAGGQLIFDAENVESSDLESDRPRLHVRTPGGTETFACDYIAGCDGFHGISRAVAAVFRDYPATIARTRTPGWAFSPKRRRPRRSWSTVCTTTGSRSSACAPPHVTRLYLQCDADEHAGPLAGRAHLERAVDSVATQTMAGRRYAGPILQKNITGMRSFVVEPMRYRRLFLAGDAAHIVPPTGAKGLNLALADVWRLARVLTDHYRSGSAAAMDAYSEHGLRRAWRAQRFSNWMTSTLHRAADASPFDHRRQQADLEYLVSSRAALTSLAENYAGFPLD